MKIIIRSLLLCCILMLLWQGIVTLFQLPDYILPAPLQVLTTLVLQSHLILTNAIPTLIETLAGLLFGVIFGLIAGFLAANIRTLRLWFLPLLLISQAIPMFAIAPLLILWLGYGITSKIAVSALVIFFPVANAFYDGLRHTPKAMLELAKTMNASPLRLLWFVRIPAALPTLSTGLRMAAVSAPMGAIVGEWVGSSQGLGYLMITANARMQIDVMFAVLIVIIAIALSLYFCVDKLLRTFIWWSKEESVS